MAAFLALLLHLHGYRLIVTGPSPYLGVTDTGTRTVTLYEYPGEPKALIRKALAYEVGHVIDFSCLSSYERHYWRHLRHIRGRWYAANYAPEQGTGAGDFADVFSAWATHSWAYFQDRPLSTHDLRVLAHRFHFDRGVCRG